MKNGGMSPRIFTNFAFEFWDVRWQFGGDRWPRGVMPHQVIHQLEKIGKFNVSRKGSLGRNGALKVLVWGLEGLAPKFPYVKVGLPPATGCEVDGLL